jgi:hypothetical protein
VSRFVAVPAARLLDELQGIGDAVADKGGSYNTSRQGNEIVANIYLPGDGPEYCRVVRVYTSLAEGAATARDCGQDAMRIVTGVEMGNAFRPLCASRKVLRTAPKGDDDSRVVAFLGRLRGAIREAYALALKAPMCNHCHAPMVERTSKHGAFYGCITYPTCKQTRSI